MATATSRERILTRHIEDEMRESFLDYSMSVIVQRAIPDVRDGLKPVHRRILYAMHELGLLPDRAYKKSATVVGDVLGKYHPHGDSAVYDALVRMVQDFSLRYPLVDGQGNFGSIDGDSAAAYRYTEARLQALATQLLDDIEKETVDYTPNFDGQLDEPVVLPGRVPNLLANGSSGIAVGMSTNIPPHNLRELAAGIRELAENPECSIEDLMQHVSGPDFPTAGFIVGDEGIRDMYHTGRGRVVMRARIVKEALRAGREQLVVTEIPYGVQKTKIVDQIVDLARKGKADEISDIRDESDRDGIRLVIELKRGASAQNVLALLYRRTYLQQTFGAILLALDHGQPREFNLKEILERYRDHRLEVIQRRSRFELEKAEAERHIVEGLIVALDHIDQVIEIIRASADRAEARAALEDRFGLSETQSDAILNMRLGKLTRLEGDELRARLEELVARIAMLRDILGSEQRQIEVMLDELDEVVAEFGDERRTVILADADEKVAEISEEVADEAVVVTVSREGFIKRMPMHLYRRRVNSGKALAGMERYEDDWIERIFVANTHGWILAFSEQGQAYYLPVMDLPESGRSSRGQSMYSLISGADRADPIVSMVPIEDLDVEGRALTFFSEGGLVKRTDLSEFSNPRSGGIIAAGVRDGDRILEVLLGDIAGEGEVLVLSRDGRAIRFVENDVPVQGRTAKGVKGIGLSDGDRVVGVVALRREGSVLTVTEDGMGKRTEVAEFPLQKRGGLGTLFAPSSGRAVPVVAALEVGSGDELMVITAAGATHRVQADTLSLQGRRTQGRRLIKPASGDRVAQVARLAGASTGRDDTPAAPDDSGDEAQAPSAPANVATGGDESAPESLGSTSGAGEGQLDLLGDAANDD
jgi:DNA gyrase subunit A